MRREHQIYEHSFWTSVQQQIRRELKQRRMWNWMQRKQILKQLNSWALSVAISYWNAYMSDVKMNCVSVATNFHLFCPVPHIKWIIKGFVVKYSMCSASWTWRFRGALINSRCHLSPADLRDSEGRGKSEIHLASPSPWAGSPELSHFSSVSRLTLTDRTKKQCNIAIIKQGVPLSYQSRYKGSGAYWLSAWEASKEACLCWRMMSQHFELTWGLQPINESIATSHEKYDICSSVQ